MAALEDVLLEKLLRDSEEVISDIDEADAGEEEGTAGSGEKLKRDARTLDMEFLNEQQEPQRDGFVDVKILGDGLEAGAVFHPANGEGKPVAIEDVERLLKGLKISFGVDWESITNAVLKCNLERAVVPGVVIARGAPSRDGIPASLEIDSSLLEKKEDGGGSARTADFKARSPFRLVRKGQLLARIIPGRGGMPGTAVTGAPIAFKNAPIAYPKPGKNTVWSGGGVVALCDGRLVLKADSFWINEVLEIGGDVDCSTGHIDFPGDVIIDGEVKRGFKMRAGGSIFCKRLIDASEIACRKDLETDQGIIGRKSGVVTVGGSLKSKYIENCYIEAQGAIAVQTGCLNSVVNTLDRLETGPKGVIIGGRLYAQNGITVNQIGMDDGPRTEIHCGIDFSIQQRLTWIRDKSLDLALKYKQVETRVKSDASNPKLVELQGRLKTAIHKLNKTAKSLINSLDKNEAAEVVVRGTVYHGSYIEICYVPYVVTNTMNRMRFILDKEKGKIVAEKLAWV